MKKKVILSAILTIALSLSILLGATYALFTSESRSSIEITSGKVSIQAEVNEQTIQTKQLGSNYQLGQENTFGGSVSFVQNQVLLDKLVPGDGVKFRVDIKNESNVPVIYRVKISSVAPDGVSQEESLLLFSGLNFKVDESNFNGVILYKSEWKDLAVGNHPANISFEIELPESLGNEYQDLSTSIVLAVEAVQGNAGYSSGEEFIRHDGSADMTNNGVQLSIPAGIFAPGVVPVLEISKPAAPTNFVVKQDTANPVTVQTLDITLPGVPVDNEEFITVVVPVSKYMPQAVVYYNNGQDLVPMVTTPVSDQPDANGLYYIQFTTTHFSEYLLVEKAYDAIITYETGKNTFAFGNLNNIMSSARNGSTVKLNKDVQVANTILVDYDITLDLNGYNVVAAENTNTIFQVRTNVPTQFNITNSQETGGNIVVNNRKLLLSYKPVSIENVNIKQFADNSSTTIKNGSQVELMQIYNFLTLENVNIDINKSSGNMINSGGAAKIIDSEIRIGEQGTNVFNMSGASSQYFAGEISTLEIDGLKLVIPSMKAEYVINRSNGTDILIHDIEILATSTRSTPALSLLSGSVGLADGSTIINLKAGIYSGVTKMQNFTDSSKPSALQVTGGTFDFDPTNFVNLELYEVIANSETQKWNVQRIS